MMKRVFKARGVLASIPALLLASALVVSPGMAKENIAANQAGDPGDGEEVFSGGSSDKNTTADLGSHGAQKQDSPVVVLIPVFASGLVMFQVVFIAHQIDARR